MKARNQGGQSFSAFRYFRWSQVPAPALVALVMAQTALRQDRDSQDEEKGEVKRSGKFMLREKERRSLKA